VKQLMNCSTTSDQVACLANARNGDAGEAEVDSTIATGVNAFVGADADNPVLSAGDITVEAFCDGMNATAIENVATNAGVTVASNGKDSVFHELNDFVPIVGAKATDIGQDVGGYAQVLFADGHVAKVQDVAGNGDEPDGFIGAYDSGSGFEINDSAFDKELRGKIWVKQLGGLSKKGGGGVLE
jgi:prepilin-type processing-associated H-X9-DG protein